ncbi:MAG: hypothetical protein BA864_11955 [Desulfuromonadales bacterium C00003093]|nr:MAG: hypothetical protein BA864_11955 [Desulfuromonadales bacterium C00003093]
MFQLDPRLQADTIYLGDFPLSSLLLLNEQTYPWFILVPRREGIREIHHLSEVDQSQLWRESAILARWMETSFKFDKLNVAVLGNIVSQLHLHHVARRVGDPTWPGPVWGQRPPVPYVEEQIDVIVKQVKKGLAEYLVGCNCSAKCAGDARGKGVCRPDGDSQAPGMGSCGPWNGRHRHISTRSE